MPELNIQNAVAAFMGLAGQSTSGMNARQACLYTGLQLEEMAEKIEAIMAGCVMYDEKFRLQGFAQQLRDWGTEFKSGRHTGDILRADRAGMLDADIDLAWVALGGAYSLSTNTTGAVDAVIDANFAKFPDGVVTRDANGKIVKPAGWRSPDMTPFVPLADD